MACDHSCIGPFKRSLGFYLAAMAFTFVAPIARATWEESGISGLLKEVTTVGMLISSCDDCPPQIVSRISVQFKNTTGSRIQFRYRFACLKGPSPAAQRQRGDSPWFKVLVEPSGPQRVASGSWEGCSIDMARAGGGVRLE